MTTHNQYSMWDEYDFGETKINPLAPYTYDKSFEIADGIACICHFTRMMPVMQCVTCSICLSIIIVLLLD